MRISTPPMAFSVSSIKRCGSSASQRLAGTTATRSFNSEATSNTNIRIDMDVYPESRSLADGDALIFGFKRTTMEFNDPTEYYDFNATIELEK